MDKKSLIGVFTDEHMALAGIMKCKSLKLKISDVYGPFADHSILHALTKPSRLPHLAFVFGAGAALSTLAFTYWTSVVSYPLNYGGKPVFSFPSLVVVMYLITILGTATLSVFAFLVRSKMYPGKKTMQPGLRANDDRFYLVMEMTPATDAQLVERVMKETGAIEIIKQ